MSSTWGAYSRELTQMTMVDGTLYIFGGVGNQLSNVMSEYNLINKRWRHTEDSSHVGRYGHCMQKHKNTLVVFGGESNFNQTIKQRECYSDVKVFDLSSRLVNKARCSGEIPEPATMCASFSFDQFFGIHGGINSKNSYLSTLFIMDLISFKWTQVPYSV